MSPALHVALAVGPLAAYFAMLGLLLGGRRPVVVPGAVDSALLAAGLGGVVVFGPVGYVLVGWLFPAPSLWAWLALASAYGLGAMLWSPRAGRRIVVYHVAPDALGPAVRESLIRLPGSFTPTVHGFEDRERGWGLVVEVGRLGVGTVEAYGADAERLALMLRSALRDRLAEVRGRPSRLAPLWLGLAVLTVVIPFLGILASRSPVLQAVRDWLGRMGGP